ncbi:hypothetical protein D9758_001297 [Tetrapyrgos nigripes]|uniref:FAD-binding FR-type domain-containing protein n=1 Tax=Tetrapyrgos nigripes TaxID=182062 RepID=A0A8H5GS22_9AGAR|nr:hypothetical protein D9758_001297 [Tetrapyrgos nigripes]
MLRTFRSRAFHASSFRAKATVENPARSFRFSKYLGTITVVGIGAATSAYFFFPDASRGAPTLKNEKLSPSHFTPCKVTSTEPCGPNSQLITVAIPPNALPHSHSATETETETSPPFSPIWSVFIKDDDIQVERPYTPLEGVNERGEMLFWIKKYPHGEVARWLHSKVVGEEIGLRGPLQTWRWEDKEWDQVIMISGGTGITPFYQLFHSVISRLPSAHKTRFTLLHSSRAPSELPPPSILKPMISYAETNPDRLKMQLCVDSYGEGDHSRHHLGQKMELGRISKLHIKKSLGDVQSWWNWFSGHSDPTNQQKTLFLVCGPESMIAAIAGPYGRNFSQGAVGGVLAELGYTSGQVYKL